MTYTVYNADDAINPIEIQTFDSEQPAYDFALTYQKEHEGECVIILDSDGNAVEF